MGRFKEKYGNTALVAGASEGMGAAFARALASHGLDLVLIARRKEPLEATAREIEKKYQVKVTPLPCDLSAPDAGQQLILAVGNQPIDFLVYNAAFSYIGPFLDTPSSTHAGIAAVNMETPLLLLHYFGGKMVERQKGGIVLMTSIAGFQGSGYLSTYAASKAFIRVLAEGLWYEWKSNNVDVIGCCAGATKTPNYLSTRPQKASLLEPSPQDPEEVAAECLRRIGRTPSFISGTGNKWVCFLMQRLFPRKKTINLMGDTMKKMYRI